MIDVTSDSLITVSMLAIGAFVLGSVPFSVWIGHRFLHKDIRDFGDGNPGSTNVFRAGNKFIGSIALLLDICKGIPFVLLAAVVYDFAFPAVFTVALSGVLGHAFSPMLRLRGGKAIAVTFGVLIGSLQPDLLISFAISMLTGFLIFRNDAWAVILGPVGAMAFLAIVGTDIVKEYFLIAILVLYVFKQFSGLKGSPGFRFKSVPPR